MVASTAVLMVVSLAVETVEMLVAMTGAKTAVWDST